MVPPVPGVATFHRSDGTWTWTLKSAGTVDGLYGRLSFGLSEEEQVIWQVLAPNDGSPVRVPQLPAPFDPFNLPPTSPMGSAELRYIGHTRGYRALLEDLEGAFFQGGQPGDVVASTRGSTGID